MPSSEEWDRNLAAIHEAFLRMGYDLHNEASIQQLKENLQWLAEKRMRSQQTKQQTAVFVWSAFAALLGAIATTTGEWLLHRLGDRP